MAPTPTKWLLVDKETEIQNIIQKLTTTGKKTVNEIEMKKLKGICKLSDKYVNSAYYALMTQLRKDHAEIRYSTLLIINELFCRSSVFRSKLELDLEEFLELVEETDPEKPLPLPAPIAKELKIKGLEFIKNWASKFGEKYIRLQLAMNFLKKCRKVDFNDMEARNVVQRERQQQEQERLNRVVNEKVAKVKVEMQEMTEEISSVAIQMENCFRLLVPHPSDNMFSAHDFEEQSSSSNVLQTDTNNTTSLDNSKAEFSSLNPENSLRDHGLYGMTRTITIEVKKGSELAVEVNEDTLPIIDNMKDLEKQISTRYFPMITRWLKILGKGNNCSDSLKKAIDLKLLLESSIEKYKELNIKPSRIKIDSDEDDDDFEEVREKEGYEEKVRVEKSMLKVSEPQPSSQNGLVFEKSLHWKLQHENDIKDPTSAASTLTKRFKSSQLLPMAADVVDTGSSTAKREEIKDHKSELLEKAPILPYDIDLYHWEDEKPLIPEVVRFDSLHKFWEGNKDDIEENETLKELQIASLRTRKIDFSGKFESVKWACRAPLPNGKLCPRRDRYKCPFHGKVIPRDALGNPSGDPRSIPGPSKEPETTGVPDWQDPQLLKDIEAATGMDLKIPDKKSKKGSRRKKEGLTNIKQINNTVRERLSKKIIKRHKHCAKQLDEIDKKRFDDKFGDQWNYY